MVTPREMLRDYMTVLNILLQNREVDFYTVVGSVRTDKSKEEKVKIQTVTAEDIVF